MHCNQCATPIPDNSRFCLACGADVSGAGRGDHTRAADVDAALERKLREDVGGAFVIDRELGRGGMAAVFLGTDVQLGRKVAIKVLPPELTFGAGAVERFKREARTAATLDHPNIIPIYGVSTGGRLFWYAMKYVEGEALSAIIERQGQMALDRTSDILRQVADALAYAHEHAVVHRDVKPANIMVESSGRVTVTDFGIAKALADQSMTGSGSMIGTPYYMSPEQCSGAKITGAADQYSLGVVAYQMVSGHLPFTGESVIDIIKRHCMDSPPPLSVLRPELPVALTNVIERALAKAPEGRFPAVGDFALAFSDVVASVAPFGRDQPRQPPRAPRTSVTYPVVPPRSPLPAADVTGPPFSIRNGPAPVMAPLTAPLSKGRRRLRVAVFAAAFVLAAGAGALAVMEVGPFGHREPVKQAPPDVRHDARSGAPDVVDSIVRRSPPGTEVAAPLRPRGAAPASGAEATGVRSEPPAPISAHVAATGSVCLSFRRGAPIAPFELLGKRYERAQRLIGGVPVGAQVVHFFSTDSTMAVDYQVIVVAGQVADCIDVDLSRK